MLDDLLHYLVTEMAMDGEEGSQARVASTQLVNIPADHIPQLLLIGCSVARLDGFIDTYYARRKAQYPAEPMQFVDASYKNFVWKKLCQLEKVRLGVLEATAVPNNEAPEDNSIHEPDILSPVPTNDTSQAKTLRLPIIASNAANKMTTRPNRLTKSVKRRSTNEAGSTSKNPDSAQPALSIGQLRAMETGKVQKSFPGSQNKRIKLDKANNKSTVSPPPSVWRELGPNLTSLPRDELISKFGLDENGESRLKIAVDPMTCWKAVVGTDTRSPKLTPYVYQVLSIVAQGREAGVTVMELGRKLKHDQKSLFHFVKVLTDLQLVAKFRAYQHKAWTNRVVHRRYLATSEWYQNSIKKDEDQRKPIQPVEQEDFNLYDIEFSNTPPPSTLENSTSDNALHSLLNDDISDANAAVPTMSPINRELLAVNETLVKSRMFTVLKRSPNNTMVHADIIKAIGIAAPTKDERRRLNRMIDSYIKRGLLERVAVANLSGHTPCIRLTNVGEESMKVAASRSEAAGMEPDDEVDEELSTVPITRSLGQTIFDLVESSGQEGMIYKVLCHKLNDIEVRTVEQILTRMEREQGPSHLSHLKVVSVLETFGREKRVRWFSTESLKSKCQTSGIQLPTDSDSLQPASAGGFIQIDQSTIDKSFYQNSSQLYSVMVPEFKGTWGKQPKKKTPAATKTEGRKKSVGGKTPAVKKNKEILRTEKNTSTPTPEPHQNAESLADINSNPTNDETNILPAKRINLESSLPTERTKRTRLCTSELTSTTMAEPLPVQSPTEAPETSANLPLPTSASDTNPIIPVNQVPTNSPQVPMQTSLCPPANPSKFRSYRQNLTSLRRENHLLEAIKYSGGIVEKSNELSKAVRDLVDRVDQDHIVGLMDNRTLNCTLHGLESKGEIKLTTVLVTDAVGASRHRKIAHLPSIQLESAEMKKWLKDLKVRFRTLDKGIESQVKENKDLGPPVNLPTRRLTQNLTVLPNGLGVNDEALHAALLNQWRCLSQLYGFVLGKAARAKILHLYLLKTFQHSNHSTASRLIINSGHRVFSSSFLFQEIPLGIFAKLVPIMTKSEEFEKLRDTPAALDVSMCNSSLAIRRLFQMGNQFSRVKMYQIVEVLCHLKLVVPLQKSQDVSEYYRISENGEAYYYSPTTMCSSVGLFCLANEGPVYDLTQKLPNPATLLSKWPLKTESDGEAFWEQLKRGSIPNPEAPPARNDVECIEDEQFFRGPPKILQLLTDESKWRDTIQLTATQREYIVRFEKQNSSSTDLETDHSTISHISHVLVTTPRAVQQAMKEFRDAVAALAQAKKKVLKVQVVKKGGKKRSAADDAEKLKSDQEEAARVLLEKAKNVLKQREIDWNALINRFKIQSGVTEIDEEVLRDLHTLFTTINGGINASQVESELAAWLQRKKAESHVPHQTEQGEELVVEIENSVGSSRRDTLPMLPSAKAKRIKMLKANAKPKPQKIPKKVPMPRVFPDKPKKISSAADNAIRPQLSVQPGARPPAHILRPGRRIRLEWDDTLDEFLRDMIAIIRARAYATSAHVLPWAIALEIFKGAKTHILRSRYAKMERDPKEKKYLELLTEAWTQVYFDKRGKVPELADPMPHVPTHLDGGLALDYLRANIDKDYLRSQANMSEKNEQTSTDNKLPDTYSDLCSNYWTRRIIQTRSERWDDFYSLSNAVVREMIILTEALSAPNQLAPIQRDAVPHQVLRAAEAIKLLTSTPIKSYSEPVAAAVLSHYPNEVLVRATDLLCMKGVIAIAGKLHYKKRLPGRSYCYTDKYLSNSQARALYESRDTSLAHLRSQSSAQDGTLTWSLFASDAETAALLHAYSRGEISLQLDLTPNRAKRWDSSTFYRSRKLDDHCIENVVQVRFKESHAAKILAIENQPTSIELEQVVETVIHAGADGITPQKLIEQLSPQFSVKTLGECVQTLTKMASPQINWASDQENSILFSSFYMENWAEKLYLKAPTNNSSSSSNSSTITGKTQVVQKDPPYLVPRLWFDLSGNFIQNLFKLSMDRVEGMVLNLPGIPYMELRRRTKSHLNALELDDVLEELIRIGRVIQVEYQKDPKVGNKTFTLHPRWIRGFDRQSHFWINP